MNESYDPKDDPKKELEKRKRFIKDAEAPMTNHPKSHREIAEEIKIMNESVTEIVRKIIYKDDFFKQYADIVPEVGERLETYVFDFAQILQTERDKVEELRANADRAIVEENCDLLAKVEELRKGVKVTHKNRHMWYSRAKSLEAEIERMRK